MVPPHKSAENLPLREAFARLPEVRMCKPEEFRFAKDERNRLIVTKPTPQEPEPSVLAVVSARYGLVQHRDVLAGALEWAKSECGVTATHVQMKISNKGAQAAFQIDLGEAMQITPDGFPVNLQFHCRNTVDSSSSLRAHLGWLRLVCTNGMMVGVSLGRMKKTHRDGLSIEKVFAEISATLAQAREDQTALAAWADRKISLDQVKNLSNGILARRWDKMSAARVWHICESGRDAKFIPPFRSDLPTEQAVRFEGDVPGSPAPARTLYDLAQAMSWVATRRNDPDDVEIRQSEIGQIVRLMCN